MPDYRGLDLRNSTLPLSVKPGDKVIFCDLRGRALSDTSFNGVEFFGCRLNGVSFPEATLVDTDFIGCFSANRFEPIDFTGCNLSRLNIIDCHFNFVSNTSKKERWCWPSEVESAASNTLSENNIERYDAVKRLGELGDVRVVPMLAYLLADFEWDVRSVTLNTIGHIYKGEYPYCNDLLLDWIFMRLGDPHSIVRQEASELIKLLSPPDKVILPSIKRMQSGLLEDKMAGLFAAIQVCLIDEHYQQFIDPELLDQLLVDKDLGVREEASYLAGIIRPEG